MIADTITGAQIVMNINEKIYYRANALYFLKWNQYCQLIDLNRLCLAPYYNERLRKQGLEVADTENFKNTFGNGKNRYEYENNI